jgi:UDP-glucose 4-epimerase
MMRVLVTGGAGYIGSVTTQQLLASGDEVEILDDLSSGHRAALPDGVRFHAGSLLDAALLDRVFARRFDAVVHFAAHSLVGESMDDPLKYYRNNVIGTLALIERVAAGGAGRFVFSSSAAVYGEPDVAPITERTATAPINPYGRTKLVMEWALADAARCGGFPAVALRYFNAAGAVRELGEDHTPETHLIPRLLRSLLDDSVDFAVFGGDYPTPDGTCIRDYVHVADLAAAHAAALRLEGTPGLTVVNLGSGHGHSVREVVAAAAAVTGRDLAPPVLPRRQGDPPRLVASNERARRLLQWRPERDLLRILDDAWRWHRRHPHGYASPAR